MMNQFKSFFLGVMVASLLLALVFYSYLSSYEGSGNPNVSLRPRRANHLIAANILATRFTALKSQFPQQQHANLYNDSKAINDVINEDLRNSNLINENELLDDNGNLGVKWHDPKLLKTSSTITKKASELGMIKSKEDKKIKDEGFKHHAFNILVSNRIGQTRSIPDTRHPLCKTQSYKSNLPTTSVIICFYNEAFSTLLRTVSSVLERTPDKYLKEILLIDDFSNDKDIKYHFMKFVYENFPSKVSLLRTPERSGLIRARLFGANHAQGDVLVFLDSHVEVNVHWLPPLLSRIVEADKKIIVTPVIDIINANTFEYTASPIVRGGFNWGLHFKWDSVPQHLLQTKADFVKPIASPTMAGGLFAVDRKYFFDIGSYDNGMDIWGGENLEMSFRIWMCGGRLEIIPCSRVGHVFRQRRPYGSPTGEDTLTKNSLRVAHVWMDEQLKYYLETRPDAAQVHYGDITERVELRKRLKCNNFEWYLKNIYPELSPPDPAAERARKKKLKGKLSKELNNSKNRKWSERRGGNRKQPPAPFVVGHYQIQVAGTNLCVESENEVTARGSKLMLARCMAIKRQLWSETDKAELRLADVLCLDSDAGYPQLAKCHELGSGQEWKHGDRKNVQIYSASAGLCMASSRKEGVTVELAMCSSSKAHNWNFISRGLQYL